MSWDDLKTRLHSFRSLKPDWDSYGADPLVPGVFERVEKLLDVLEDAGFDKPTIVPTNVGGVCLDWEDWEIKVEAIKVEATE